MPERGLGTEAQRFSWPCVSLATPLVRPSCAAVMLPADRRQRLGESCGAPGPNPRTTASPGIFDVVADLFSVPGPIAVAGLSTGQSGRRGAPTLAAPQSAEPKAPRPALVVTVSAGLHARQAAGGRGLVADRRQPMGESGAAASIRKSGYRFRVRGGLRCWAAGYLALSGVGSR